MLVVERLLGSVEDIETRDRVIDFVAVASRDAERSHFRTQSNLGREVVFRLPRGSFLAAGAVIEVTENCVTVIDRLPEAAVVVVLADKAPLEDVVRTAVRIGHVFGNQHVPLEVEKLEINIPITTHAGLVAATIEEAGTAGAYRVERRSTKLAARRPLWTNGLQEG